MDFAELKTNVAEVFREIRSYFIISLIVAILIGVFIGLIREREVSDQDKKAQMEQADTKIKYRDIYELYYTGAINNEEYLNGIVEEMINQSPELYGVDVGFETITPAIQNVQITTEDQSIAQQPDTQNADEPETIFEEPGTSPENPPIISPSE